MNEINNMNAPQYDAGAATPLKKFLVTKHCEHETGTYEVEAASLAEAMAGAKKDDIHHLVDDWTGGCDFGAGEAWEIIVQEGEYDNTTGEPVTWTSPDYILKAAAPVMLEALRECESLLAELRDGGAENPELEIVRAAIALATPCQE